MFVLRAALEHHFHNQSLAVKRRRACNGALGEIASVRSRSSVLGHPQKKGDALIGGTEVRALRLHGDSLIAQASSEGVFQLQSSAKRANASPHLLTGSAAVAGSSRSDPLVAAPSTPVAAASEASLQLLARTALVASTSASRWLLGRLKFSTGCKIQCMQALASSLACMQTALQWGGKQPRTHSSRSRDADPLVSAYSVAEAVVCRPIEDMPELELAAADAATRVWGLRASLTASACSPQASALAAKHRARLVSTGIARSSYIAAHSACKSQPERIPFATPATNESGESWVVALENAIKLIA